MRPTVLIVSHDAGGAEVVAAWCADNRVRFNLRFALAGPAIHIFGRELGDVKCCGIEEMGRITGDGFVLTGTSMESDHERKAIAMACGQRIRCISCLDHWDLYKERFGAGDDWADALPDEIWVGDEYAMEYARRSGFPMEKVSLVPNPHFERLRGLAGTAPFSNVPEPGTFLYLTEPLRLKLEATFGSEASAYDDEIDNLARCLECAALHSHNISRFTLRVHPKENHTKYQTLVASFQDRLPLVFSKGSLLDDMAVHSTAMGMETMGLVVGLLLGRKAVSCITGKSWEISLPHREIIRLRDWGELFDNDNL